VSLRRARLRARAVSLQCRGESFAKGKPERSAVPGPARGRGSGEVLPIGLPSAGASQEDLQPHRFPVLRSCGGQFCRQPVS